MQLSRGCAPESLTASESCATCRRAAGTADPRACSSNLRNSRLFSPACLNYMANNQKSATPELRNTASSVQCASVALAPACHGISSGKSYSIIHICILSLSMQMMSCAVLAQCHGSGRSTRIPRGGRRSFRIPRGKLCTRSTHPGPDAGGCCATAPGTVILQMLVQKVC